MRAAATRTVALCLMRPADCGSFEAESPQCMVSNYRPLFLRQCRGNELKAPVTQTLARMSRSRARWMFRGSSAALRL